MRQITTTWRFDREYALLLRKGVADLDDMGHFVYLLEHRDELPPEYGEHPLTDDWEGYLDAHLSSDVVVIFKRFESRVKLSRIGTHEDLFPHRKGKSKGLKKPEPTFDEVLESALADTARKMKRWWRGRR